MIYAKINADAIEVLRKQIGRRLVSYVCGAGELMFDRAYGKIRLNFEREGLEIDNTQKPFSILGEEEEAAYFVCKRTEVMEPFIPVVDDEETTVREIGERITDVEIIEERIDINDGEYQAVFDMALILRMEHRILMLARGWHYSELICLTEDDDYDRLYPVEQDGEAWSNDGDHAVEISRRTISLAE